MLGVLWCPPLAQASAAEGSCLLGWTGQLKLTCVCGLRRQTDFFTRIRLRKFLESLTKTGAGCDVGDVSPALEAMGLRWIPPGAPSCVLRQVGVSRGLTLSDGGPLSRSSRCFQSSAFPVFRAVTGRAAKGQIRNRDIEGVAWASEWPLPCRCRQ